jgi:hypothetical protein
MHHDHKAPYRLAKINYNSNRKRLDKHAKFLQDPLCPLVFETAAALFMQ